MPPKTSNDSQMTTQKLLLLTTLCTGVFCTVTSAQSDAGLIGKQYFQVNVVTEDARKIPVSNGYGFGGGVNLPVLPSLDVALDASYLRYDDFDFTEHRVNALARGHLAETNGIRMFGDVMLAYDAQKSVVGGVKYKSDNGLYGIGSGAEVAVTPATALLVRIARSDWFDHDLDGYWTYTVGANHWFTPKLNVSADVTWLDAETLTYRLSCNVRF